MTLYDKLGCARNDSYEKIKKCYHELVLLYHPDKSDSSNNCKFHEIQTAWDILRDDKSRKDYDSVLLQASCDSERLLYDTIRINDLNYDEPTDIASYPCRCGSNFSFIKGSVKEIDHFIVDCDDCSLCLFVLNSSESNDKS